MLRVVVHQNKSFSDKFLDNGEGCIVCRCPVPHYVSTCQLSDGQELSHVADKLAEMLDIFHLLLASASSG